MSPGKASQYCSGPWRVEDPLEEGGTELIVVNCDWVICEMAEGLDVEGAMEANAHLIAAAPEMLEACKAFVEAWEKSLQLEKTDHALALCKAAIAKAEGRA